MDQNIDSMLRLAGSPSWLRPPVKTHKCPAIVAHQMFGGIRKFKFATIAEAEVIAQNGGNSVLLAKQAVGTDIAQLAKLRETYPATEFLGIVDNRNTLKQIAFLFSRRSMTIDLLLNADCGMGRTELPSGSKLMELYRAIAAEPAIITAGLIFTTATFRTLPQNCVGSDARKLSSRSLKSSLALK